MTNYREIVLPKRPGCLTILAILYFVSAACYLLNGALVAAGFVESPYETFGRFSAIEIGLLIATSALIPLAIAYGLWKLQVWAWWIVVVTSSFSVLSLVLTIVGTLYIDPTQLSGEPGFVTFVNSFKVIIITIVAMILVINGGILGWFLQNKFLFVGHYYRYPGLEPAAAPRAAKVSSNKDLVLTMGALAVILILVFLIGATLIAFL
ncbi:MAG: hypothetical protein KDE34_14215 [Anaerolineales bacterium]|nr:hypothetical protein [Anaerolineales bacterium]